MEIHLEKATVNDVDIVYEWFKDATTRKYAFSKGDVSYAEHQIWYLNKLQDENSVLFIAKKDEIDVGQIRIDYICEKRAGVISYSVDKAYRGRGYGKDILTSAELYLNGNSVWNGDLRELVGRVKKENIPSQKCFEKLGYTKIICKEYIEYRKQIKK